MKKILTLTLATLSLGLAPAAMADWDVFNRIEVHGAGTYTKPSNNGLELGGSQALQGVSPLFLGNPVIAQRLLHLEPGFDWNYALGGSYLFCGTQTRFFVDFDHYRGHDHRAGGPFDQGILLNGSLFSRVDMQQNMFRVGFDQELPFCDSFWLRSAVFFEYDRLVQRLYEHFFIGAIIDEDGDIVTPERRTALLVDNKLNGWGPGIGLKGLWAPWCRCPEFKFFGGIMGSILFSRQHGYLFHELPAQSSDDNQVGILAIAPDPTVPPHQVIIDPTNIALVSKFDIDLGFEYSRKFCVDNAKMLLGLTVGVRYQNMINALKYSNRYQFTLYQPLTNYNPLDWGRAGPYIQLKIGGADSK